MISIRGGRKLNESSLKPKLYLETTIPSYYAARPSKDVVIAGHQYTTREWWETRIGDYDVFVSELVFKEAARGDSDAAGRRCALIEGFPILGITQAALDLAAIYLAELQVPPNAEADALHLALATLNSMDYLLTWNCRHIARGSVIRSLPVVNSKYGYGTPAICTPEELLYENPGIVD